MVRYTIDAVVRIEYLLHFLLIVYYLHSACKDKPHGAMFTRRHSGHGETLLRARVVVRLINLLMR